MRNQPVEEIYGANAKPTYKDIGVKWKYVWSKSKQEDDEMRVEPKDEVAYFIEADETHNMAGYNGQPEFDIADKRSYDTTQQGNLPFIRFHSHLEEDELLPLPDQHTLDYSKVHWELERWTLFTQLPALMKYDRNTRLLLEQMQEGQIQVPDYINEINPPSLWTYFSTLPSWARADPLVRNTMMAMEYHKPGTDIRQKEQLLNLACSFLRPIDSTLREVLAEACMSNKV